MWSPCFFVGIFKKPRKTAPIRPAYLSLSAQQQGLPQNARQPLLGPFSIAKKIFQLAKETFSLLIILFIGGFVQLCEKFPLTLGKVLGNLHRNLDILISPGAGVKPLDALPL